MHHSPVGVPDGVISPNLARAGNAGNSWGGARNRGDRTSFALTEQQAVEIIRASERALAIGLPLTRFITVHYGAAGISDEQAAAATGRYLKLLTDLARTAGKSVAWVYVRENDEGDGSKGSHVHIFAHVPAGINLGVMNRRWGAKLCGAKYVAGMIDTRRIGGTVNAWRTCPEAYRANLGHVLGYALKGITTGTADRLGLARHGEGGRIIGKRCGRSQNLRRIK